MDISVSSADFPRLREIIDLHVPLNEQYNIDGEVLITLMGLYNIQYTVQRNARRVAERTLKITPSTMVMNNDESSCAICIDKFERGASVIRLNCNHTFHHTCLSEWIKYKSTCPMCVADLSEVVDIDGRTD